MRWGLGRCLTLSLAIVCGFGASSFAQAAPQQERVASLVAEQVLSSLMLEEQNLVITETAKQSLSQTGLQADRFQLDAVNVLKTNSAGNMQVITLVASYREQTRRRLWLVIRAWYREVGGTVTISRAEPYWNSPESPEVQLRLLPHDAVSDTPGAANTYAKSVDILGDIVEAALDPGDPLPRSTDIAVVFIDRIAFDAQITVTSSAESDGEPLWTVDMRRLDATGWPILLIDGSQLSGKFLQIRYRPGSDRDPAGAVSTIVAAYPISALRRQ